jgi:replicative DNA helicase
MKIKIAISNSFKYKIKNKEFTYEEFKNYLLGFNAISIIFNNEKNKDFEEALKDSIKSYKDRISGFVGGQFNKDEIERQDENLSYRSLIVLDIDNYSKDLSSLENSLRDELGKYKYIAYSTISHTKENPKIRLILFPNSNIPTKKYKQVSENFIKTLSFKDAIDEASTKPNQFMLISVRPELNYLPEGKEYYYEKWHLENDGELVDIEEYSVDTTTLSETTDLIDDDIDIKNFITASLNTPISLTDEGVLIYINGYCEPKSANYHTWLNVGQALHHQYMGGGKGKDFWLEWSNVYKRSEDHINEIDIKWKSFSQNKESPFTMRSIIKEFNEQRNQQIVSIEELRKQIKEDQINQKEKPLDLNKYRKEIHRIEKQLLEDDIRTNEHEFKRLKTILSNITKYNNLLTTNYEQDEPYKYSSFLEDIGKKPTGLKTGFSNLDKHITIQPASLVFIAGRPSHGKTMTMINLYGNMIEANPDKAFLFYSYEENKEDILLKIILSKTASSISLDKETGSTLFDKAKNHLKNYALIAKTQKDGTIETLDSNLDNVCKKVEQWMGEGRLQILDKKAKVEILSSAIIERINASEKPVAAIFIDYVQKLNTEEERVNRQQEIQRICQTLLNTALDERVNAAIILGAQVNREVKSLDTFTLDNMREAGDIEQDANLVLGVWDEQAGRLDSLQQKLNAINDKIEEIEFGIKPGDQKPLKESRRKIENEMNTLCTNVETKPLKIKVLKNRNGKKDFVAELESYTSRFLIQDKRNIPITFFENSIKNLD